MVCITSRNGLTIFPDITIAAAMDNAAIIPHSVYIIVNSVELRLGKFSNPRLGQRDLCVTEGL